MFYGTLIRLRRRLIKTLVGPGGPVPSSSAPEKSRGELSLRGSDRVFVVSYVQRTRLVLRQNTGYSWSILEGGQYDFCCLYSNSCYDRRVVSEVFAIDLTLGQLSLKIYLVYKPRSTDLTVTGVHDNIGDIFVGPLVTGEDPSLQSPRRVGSRSRHDVFFRRCGVGRDG